MTLARLEIPSEDIRTLRALANLTDETMEALLDALSKIPLNVDFDASLKTIAPQLASLSIDKSDRLAGVLVSLSVTRAHSDTPVPDFVADILHAMEEADAETLAGDKRDRARNNLAKLLSFEPLSTAAKAHHLLLDQGTHARYRSYFYRCAARVWPRPEATS